MLWQLIPDRYFERWPLDFITILCDLKHIKTDKVVSVCGRVFGITGAQYLGIADPASLYVRYSIGIMVNMPSRLDYGYYGIRGSASRFHFRENLESSELG